MGISRTWWCTFQHNFRLQPSPSQLCHVPVLETVTVYNVTEEFCTSFLACNLAKSINFLAVRYSPVGAILAVFSFLRVLDSPVASNKCNTLLFKHNSRLCSFQTECCKTKANTICGTLPGHWQRAQTI